MRQFLISRILVPVDFSQRSEDAARAAKRLAAHFGAELILLHVVEPFHVDFAMLEPFEDSLRKLSQAHLAKRQSQLDAFGLPELQGANITRAIGEGTAAAEILECAKSRNADLVVMPTRGHSRLRGLLIGSVTAKVLDESDGPVLTVTHLKPEGDLADWRIRHILCAVDLGTRSDCVLRWGAALAEEFHAQVSVLHVASDPKIGDRVAKAIEAAGIKAESLIAAGEPHKVVADTAARLGADLVIIGRGVATDTLGRLRAQGYGIVRQAPCPVLSV